MKKIIFILCFSILFGCKSAIKIPKAKTLGEENTSYSYIPIDPLPITTMEGKGCYGTKEDNFEPLKKALPDQAVRLASVQINGSASGSFGPATVGYENNQYKVVLDYISVDATQIPLSVIKEIPDAGGKHHKVPLYSDTSGKDAHYIISRVSTDYLMKEDNVKSHSDKADLVILPVYIGVGLRLTATVFVSKGSGTVNLSSLVSIASEAEAGKLTGTLTVQTLGITGEKVSSSLPLPSEINPTTIQNAILSLGSIKAIIHDENTYLKPRVVGVYNTIGGGKEVINGIITALAQKPILWDRPCEK